MESTDSDNPPPDALDIVVTVMLEYPPMVDAAAKALAPSASEPLVTT